MRKKEESCACCTDSSPASLPEMLGEIIGTFLIVFFGCSTVAVTVLFSAQGLFQVACLWGTGVTLAIYSTRHLCCAHLNPAVSLAMVFAGRMSKGKLLPYWGAQFLGAFAAPALIYGLFHGPIEQFELAKNIVRGAPESVRSAMIFGEFYPNPGVSGYVVSQASAFLAEAVGTFVLVFMIFSLTEGCNVGRPDNRIAPVFIGLTVTTIISIVAPLTQAGLNPARDFSPRLFSYLAGWGSAALPAGRFGFLTVYILAPLVGGSLASLFFTWIVEPAMERKLRQQGHVVCLASEATGAQAGHLDG